VGVRRGLLIAAAVAAVLGVVLLAMGRGGVQIGGFYLMAQAAACVLAVLFERRGSRSSAPLVSRGRRAGPRSAGLSNRPLTGEDDGARGA